MNRRMGRKMQRHHRQSQSPRRHRRTYGQKGRRGRVRRNRPGRRLEMGQRFHIGHKRRANDQPLNVACASSSWGAPHRGQRGFRRLDLSLEISRGPADHPGSGRQLRGRAIHFAQSSPYPI